MAVVITFRLSPAPLGGDLLEVCVCVPPPTDTAHARQRTRRARYKCFVLDDTRRSSCCALRRSGRCCGVSRYETCDAAPTACHGKSRMACRRRVRERVGSRKRLLTERTIQHDEVELQGASAATTQEHESYGGKSRGYRAVIRPV